MPSSMWCHHVGINRAPLANGTANHFFRHFLPLLQDFKRYTVGDGHWRDHQRAPICLYHCIVARLRMANHVLCL